MARTWKIVLILSLLVNGILAWKVFYPHAPNDSARMYYQQTVINLRLAVNALDEASSSSEERDIITWIHLANQHLHEALFDMHYYEDAFNRRRIQAGNLSAELYTRWQDLSRIEFGLIKGENPDNEYIRYLLKNLAYWSDNLPDVYTKQTVGQIKRTMNDVDELKPDIRVSSGDE
ncbi:hypothetical protein [Paenibacillus soyae]|uniref:Uncharacterized protein n=1 Tax=Paenibacillus soyae TaxID=2969249 RepID=A0A9X2SB23_9BACL|nr:hypothetical protein [Paenibacillus soyae]MCR2805223.1 hypothetical protein [Paenibacillus soyae]